MSKARACDGCLLRTARSSVVQRQFPPARRTSSESGREWLAQHCCGSPGGASSTGSVTMAAPAAGKSGVAAPPAAVAAAAAAADSRATTASTDGEGDKGSGDKASDKKKRPPFQPQEDSENCTCALRPRCGVLQTGRHVGARCAAAMPL